MFRRLSDFVIRYRIAIVIFWVLAAAGMYLFAPSLSQTGKMDQSRFLPASAESQKANSLISQYFPGNGSRSSGTLVFYHGGGLTDADYSFGKQVQAWLLSDSNKANVSSVSTIFNSPELASRLVSPDKTTMLMNVSLASGVESGSSSDTVAAIRGYVDDAPSGLEVYVSGQAGIYSDLFGSLRSSMDLTTIITVVLVVVLLLVIYRSPVASLVPLFTIGMAYLVSRGILGLAAQAGISIWSQIDVFLIVLVFGAGTDYCLFMVSRFREELKRNDSFGAATKATVTRISSVITASAFAVIIGLSGMAVARFQMIQTMGPVMAVAILITLFAALTLTPAITSLFGSKLFWPAHARVHAEPSEAHTGFWARVAGITTGHPAIVVPVVLAVMAVPLLALPHYQRSYDQLSELPARSDSTLGYRVLQDHFNVGEMDPLTTIVISPDSSKITSPEGLSSLVKLGNDVRATRGVAQVQSLIQPYGTAEVPAQMTVSGQLSTMVASFTGGAQSSAQGSAQPSAQSSAQPGANMTAVNMTALAQGVGTIRKYLAELGDAFSWAKQDASYTGMSQAAGSMQTQLQSLGSGTLTAEQMAAASAQLQKSLGALAQNGSALSARFKASGDPPFIPSSAAADPQTAGAMRLFVSGDGQAARFYVVLSSSPQSAEALTAVKDIRTTIKADLATAGMKGYQVAVGGSTASMSDMKSLLDSDFVRIQLVVLFGVFIVFVALLRSLVAPLYLLATVLLSYATTLGLVTWIFQDLQGQEGISFIVPIIVFVLLVALGADYNIFLMSRVREESETHPTREAARIAAGATGSVITACGLILAGTFAALIVSPLRIMAQVGAAVGLGILIDTFVVRSLLVPAIATLVGRANWWPSKFGVLVEKVPQNAGRAVPARKAPRGVVEEAD
jgi:putative drug exporter of the RND superfamily